MMTSNLTKKEVSYLDEALAMEHDEVLKFQNAAGLSTDPQCKSLLNNIAQMHQGHFDTLKKHLDSCQG